jgi:hypothetical protein
MALRWHLGRLIEARPPLDDETWDLVKRLERDLKKVLK